LQGSLKTRLIVLFALFACIPVLAGTLINGYVSMTNLRESTLTANLNLNREIASGIKRKRCGCSDANGSNYGFCDIKAGFGRYSKEKSSV